MTRVIRFHETGGPDVLKIEDFEPGTPGPDEMLVRIEAIGLNRAEAMFRSGTYLEQPTLPATLGYEASGIVEALGSHVQGFSAGDEICVIPAFSLNQYGVYAEKSIVPASAVVKRPRGINAIEAAAVWMQYLTAWGALVDIAQLDKGQTVIIPAASSSVGLAAIQISNSIGAIPIAMTRTSAKKKQLGLSGAAHVIASEEQDVVEEVMRITGGQGAHIVFDPVAGQGVEILANTLRQGGTLFVYGNLSGRTTPFPLGPALLKGLTLRGYTLFEITSDAERLKRGKAFITNGLENGLLKPIIGKTFAFDEIVDAHEYLESNQQFGKIVVTLM